MNKRYIVFGILLTGVIGFSAFTHGNEKSGGGPPYNTNAPGDQTCSGIEGTNPCHSGGIPDNSGPASTLITFSGGTTYSPGKTYVVTARINHPSRNRFGFQIVSVINSSGANAGTVTLTDTARTRAQIPNWGSYQDRNYVMHVLNGTYGTGNADQWSYNWTAPAGNVGPVTFYACFLAANDNGTNDAGDETYFKALTITYAPTGIAEQEDSPADIMIFPNPARDQITIACKRKVGGLFKAELFDLQGKLMQTLIENKQAGSVIMEKAQVRSDLARGVYLVRCTTEGGGQLTRKITIE